MEIIVLGLNHTTAPVPLRERLHFSDADRASALQILGQRPELSERMLLSTCNRVEIYAVVEEVEKAREILVSFLADYHHLLPGDFQEALYLHRGSDAIRHALRVAASLDSMVVGEAQILGQVKEAYAAARSHRATGVILNTLLEKAFHTAKRIRTETGIGAAAVSIPTAAIALAHKIFGDLSGRIVMLLGAGKMSELAASHLQSNGVQLLVANRRFERGLELAGRLHGHAIRFEAMREAMATADIVIASTGAPHPILTRADLQEVLTMRRNRPIFLVDIAVPRDIDPTVNDLDNVYLYNIDDLEAVVEGNRTERQREATQAEVIIEQETQRFLNWLQSLEVVPTIVQMQEKLEAIRSEELQKSLAKLAHLSPQEKEAIDALTLTIVNKILHDPMTELRRQSTLRNGPLYATVLRRLFGMDREGKV